MKIIFNYLCLVFFFSPTSQALAYKVPLKARELLNSLPEKSLTLDIIIKKGLSSDSFNIIKTQILQKQIFNYSSKIAFDTYLSGLFIKGRDKSASTRPGSSYNKRFTNGVIRLNRSFPTGTDISVESNYQKINSFSSSFLGQGPDIHSQYNENKISLNFKQNLVKNSFGFSSRKTLKALNIKKNNVENNLALNIENWADALIQSFYNAWLLQSKVKVAMANFNRQTRLLTVTNLKFKRGTSKKSELLQVKSAHKNSNQNLEKAKQELKSIWRNLIATLNLPTSWGTINPLLIPIKLDNPINKAQNFCKNPLDLNSNTEFKSLTEQNKAKRLNLSAAKNQLLPDVYLGVKLTSNGVNPTDSNLAFKNSLQTKNQGLFVELGISIPLGNYKEKSKLAQATMEERSSYYQLASLKNNLTAQWLNECQNLQRLVKKQKELKIIYFMQKQRAQLEEDRFKIGKISVFTTIQSAQDATLAELAFKQSKIKARLSSWKILNLNGKLLTYIKKTSKDKK